MFNLLISDALDGEKRYWSEAEMNAFKLKEHFQFFQTQEIMLKPPSL